MTHVGLNPTRDMMIGFGAKCADDNWWRIPVSYFVPAGFVPFVLTWGIQLMAGLYLEKSWGTLRVFAVLCCGVWGGMRASCTADSNFVSTGQTSGCMGLLGAYIVDVFSYWQIFPRYTFRRYATIWFLLVVVLLLMCLFDHNDPIAAVAGLGFGIIASIGLVPLSGFQSTTSTILQFSVFVGTLVVIFHGLDGCVNG